jgi:hypothetical protein
MPTSISTCSFIDGILLPIRCCMLNDALHSRWLLRHNQTSCMPTGAGTCSVDNDCTSTLSLWCLERYFEDFHLRSSNFLYADRYQYLLPYHHTGTRTSQYPESYLKDSHPSLLQVQTSCLLIGTPCFEFYQKVCSPHQNQGSRRYRAHVDVGA